MRVLVMIAFVLGSCSATEPTMEHPEEINSERRLSTNMHS